MVKYQLLLCSCPFFLQLMFHFINCLSGLILNVTSIEPFFINIQSFSENLIERLKKSMSSFINGRLKEPLQDSVSFESMIHPGNITNDILDTGILDSNVVSHQEFSKLLLMDQTGGIQFHSDQYPNPNVGFLSFVDDNTQDSGSNSYRLRNGISDSKYLKPAQQLLNEIVHIKKYQKQEFTKQKSMKDSHEILRESESESQQDSGLQSTVEKQDLQNKITKLSSMLKEVDRRYKQYYHQMQIIISSFEVIAGSGSAKTYTSLPFGTISTHFRCLKDAISSQIKVISRSIGETDSNGNGIVISRLRFVDHQLRRRKHDQKINMMNQQIWRPQRGLPEGCVWILRAWLFEHFLHPYPKDSEKMMLARQTGLTKSQVSNWFINARVRLWKPMVEEMYQEESTNVAMDSNSSSEITPKNTSLDQPHNMNHNGASSYQVLHTRTTGPIVNGFNIIPNPIINKQVLLMLTLHHTDNSSVSSLENHHRDLVDPIDVICDNPNLNSPKL